MKGFQKILLFCLTVGLCIGLNLTFSLIVPSGGSAQITPRPNPQQLKQAFDRKDIATAVRLVETGWQQQYEDYYQGRLRSQRLEVDAIARALERTRQETGKTTALFYAIPTPTALELVLISPRSAPVHRRIAAPIDRH